MIAAAVLFAAVIDCEAYTYDANRVIGSEPLGQVVTQPIASHVELFSTEENLLMTYSINAYYAKRDSLDAFNKTKNKRGLRSTGLVIRPEIGLGYYMWPNHFFDWGGYWQWMYHQNNVLWGTITKLIFEYRCKCWLSIYTSYLFWRRGRICYRIIETTLP